MVVEMCGGVDTAFALTVQSVSTEIELRIVLRDGRGQASSHIELVKSQNLAVGKCRRSCSYSFPWRRHEFGLREGRWQRKMLAVEVTQGFL